MEPTPFGRLAPACGCPRSEEGLTERGAAHLAALARFEVQNDVTANGIHHLHPGRRVRGLSSWGITHWYYKKAGNDQRTELDRLRTALRSKNTLADFEERLSSDKWSKTYVDNREVWICSADNTFQIHESEHHRPFQEPWTKGFPDPNSTASEIYLKIGPTTIHQVTFVSLDGRRVFVPVPNLRGRGDSDDPQYVWSRSSLEFKLCGVIGQYYIHNDLHGIARRTGVELVD